MKKLIHNENLNEINMSPGALRQAAAGINIVAGMEFEVVMPEAVISHFGALGGYPNDESATGVDQTVQYFSNGDVPNSPEVIEALRQAINQEAVGESDRTVEDHFASSAGRKFFARWYTENFDLSDIKSAAESAVKRTKPDMFPGSTAYKEEVDAEYRKRLTAFLRDEFGNEQLANECFLEFKKQYAENFDPDDWVAEFGLMSGIHNRYKESIPELNWPYNDQSDEISTLADEFAKAVGREAESSAAYHEAKRLPGKYAVEPDASIEPSNTGDSGVEFVSPALPLDELIGELSRAVRWFKSKGAYTNSSTGLHINVSFPGLNINDLDYVKLALLVGDEYVLTQFGRQANTYCRSAVSKVRATLEKSPKLASKVLDKMREHLNVEASHLIHPPKTLKNVSINIKEGYVEFRSPGGDWLNYDLNGLVNFLLRFSVALSAASDPEKHRREYLKKLYVLLDASTSKPVEQFAAYAVGDRGSAPKFASAVVGSSGE